MNDSLAYQRPMQVFDGGFYQNGVQVAESSNAQLTCVSTCWYCHVRLPATWDRHACWCPYHKCDQVPVGDGTFVLAICIIVYVFFKKLRTPKKVIR